MEAMPKVAPDAYVSAMRAKMESMLAEVMDAINHAPDGSIIAGSEHQVRDLFGEFRESAFRTALQMRIDAAEAAFSPSEGSAERQEPAS